MKFERETNVNGLPYIYDQNCILRMSPKDAKNLVDYCNISKLSESFFPGKFISPKIWEKIAQNDPKIGFFEFFEKF